MYIWNVKLGTCSVCGTCSICKIKDQLPKRQLRIPVPIRLQQVHQVHLQAADLLEFLGRYACDPEVVRAAIEGVAAQTGGAKKE